MANDFTRGIKVYLDTQQYSKSLVEMGNKLNEYRQRLVALTNAGKGASKDADRLRQSIVRLETTQKKYRDEITATAGVLRNLSGVSYNELKNARQRVILQLRQMNPQTQEYRDLLKTLNATETELTMRTREMNAVNATTGNIFQRLSSTLNKYFLMISTVVSGLTMLIMAGRKSVQTFMEIEESLTKIRKYTGLTTDEVNKLYKSLVNLENLDTRTSIKDLLELAQAAGRLGIKGTKNLEDFVRAADKIQIALGEDLGADAVTNIGKLANLFGEDKRIGLEDAMLSTASAVTKLAKSSTACEPYLVNFASRLGGIGAVSNMTAADILGIGSALDQNMQKVEMSSTAISTLITKIFQEPAKFAKIAGLEVQEFTELRLKDANEALLQFLEAMHQKGGFDKLAPMFKDMQMDGKRAIQVLSTLAGHVDQVREAQLLANAAYDANIEVQTEFDKMNSTSMAKLEKRKKILEDMRKDLGERFIPVLMHIKTAQSYIIRGLNGLINLFTNFRSTILYMTIAITAYNLVLNAQVVAQKLVAFWNDKLVVSFKKLWTVIKSNPWGLVISAMTLVTGLISDISRKTKQLVSQFGSLDSVLSRADYDTDSDVKHIKSLLAVLNEEDLSYERKAAAIGELISMNPKFLGCLDARTSSYEQAAEAVNKYIKFLTLQNRIEALQAERDEIDAAEADYAGTGKTKFLNWLYKNYWRIQQRFKNQGEALYEDEDGNPVYSWDLSKDEYKTFIDNQILPKAKENPYFHVFYSQRREEIDSLLADLQKELDEMTLDAAAALVDDNDYSPVGRLTADTIKEKFEGSGGIIETLNDEYNRIEHELKMALARREITQSEYDIRSAENEVAHQNALVSVYKRYSDSMANAEFDKDTKRETVLKQIHKKQIKSEQDHDDALVAVRETYSKAWENLLKLDAKNEDDATAKLDIEYQKRLRSASEYFNALRLFLYTTVNDMNQLFIMLSQVNAAYDNSLSQLSSWYNTEKADIDFQNAKEHLQLLKKYSLDTTRNDYELSLRELENYYRDGKLSYDEYLSARELMYQESERKIADERRKIVDKYVTPSIQSQYELELRELELAHQSGLISETDYQKSLASLKFKYAMQYADQYREMTVNMIDSLQQAEIDAVDSKYAILLQEAENNGEDTEQLEMEQANAKLEIQKKYALSNLLVKLSQITADTAVAIMTCFAQLGPVAGAVAAAMLAATGIAQYSSAFSEYERIKGISLKSSPASSSNPASSGYARVVQHSDGSYDVIGADDGRLYRGVPYIGNDVTGIVRHPALISENGSELIVSADTLSRLRTHVNYQVVVDAINDARSGRVPQHSDGNLSLLPSHDSVSVDNSAVISLLVSIQKSIDSLPREVRSYVLLDDLNAASQLKSRSQSPFTRGDKH